MQRKKIFSLFLFLIILGESSFSLETEFYNKMRVMLEAEKVKYLKNSQWENKVLIYQSLFPRLSQFFNIMGENMEYTGRTRMIFYGMASAYADIYFALNFLEKKITAPIFEQIVGEKLKRVKEELCQGLYKICLLQMKNYGEVSAIEKQNKIDNILKVFIEILNESVIKSDEHETVNKYFSVGYVLAYQFILAFGHYLENEEYDVEKLISYLHNEIYFAKENQVLKKETEKDKK